MNAFLYWPNIRQNLWEYLIKCIYLTYNITHNPDTTYSKAKANKNLEGLMRSCIPGWSCHSWRWRRRRAWWLCPRACSHTAAQTLARWWVDQVLLLPAGKMMFKKKNITCNICNEIYQFKKCNSLQIVKKKLVIHHALKKGWFTKILLFSPTVTISLHKFMHLNTKIKKWFFSQIIEV